MLRDLDQLILIKGFMLQLKTFYISGILQYAVLYMVVRHELTALAAAKGLELLTFVIIVCLWLARPFSYHVSL